MFGGSHYEIHEKRILFIHFHFSKRKGGPRRESQGGGDVHKE